MFTSPGACLVCGIEARLDRLCMEHREEFEISPERQRRDAVVNDRLEGKAERGRSAFRDFCARAFAERLYTSAATHCAHRTPLGEECARCGGPAKLET